LPPLSISGGFFYFIILLEIYLYLINVKSPLFPIKNSTANIQFVRSKQYTGKIVARFMQNTQKKVQKRQISVLFYLLK